MVDYCPAAEFLMVDRKVSQLYSFIKRELVQCGIKDIWLSADKITGEPLWFSLGFTDTGERESEQKVLQIEVY